MALPQRNAYLRRKRIRAGHTLSSLAPLVGCGVPHLSNIEAGLRSPGPGLFGRLATVLDVDVEELIDNTPTPPSQPLRVRASRQDTENGRAA